MRCHRRKSRFWLKIILFISLIYLILYILLIHVSFVDEQEINLCSSLKHENNDKIKYIFNLDRWRGLMLNDRIDCLGNGTLWCDIPSELRPISNAICRTINSKKAIHSQTTSYIYWTNTQTINYFKRK